MHLNAQTQELIPDHIGEPCPVCEDPIVEISTTLGGFFMLYCERCATVYNIRTPETDYTVHEDDGLFVASVVDSINSL